MLWILEFVVALGIAWFSIGAVNGAIFALATVLVLMFGRFFVGALLTAVFSQQWRQANLNRFVVISELTTIALFLGVVLLVNPSLILAGAAAAGVDFYFQRESEKALGMRR